MLNFLAAIGNSGVTAGAGSFESIATATASGSASSITISSIPNTYSALQVRYISNSGRAVNGFESMFITLNNDTGTNYARHFLLGSGSSVSASGDANQTSFTAATACGLDAPIMGVGIIDLHDYASTTRNKTIRVFTGVDFNDTGLTPRIFTNSALWLNNAAVSSITFRTNTGSNFTNNTTFALYGIKGA